MKTNISAATIARTAALARALTHPLLSACGKPLLPIESQQLEQLLTSGITASTGTSFMRCSNGVQLCWGTVAADAASVRLPAPFANTGYAVSFAGVGAADRYLAPEGKTTSTFTPGGSGAFDYLAVGRWK